MTNDNAVPLSDHLLRCYVENQGLPDRKAMALECIASRKRIAELEAENRLLWTELTEVVSIDRIKALSEAVIAARKAGAA